MWMKILLKVISSEMTKKLIGLAIKKLLEHKSDGVTRDVIETVLDGAVESRSNNLTSLDTLSVKNALAGK
jgi:hypothetical protein